MQRQESKESRTLDIPHQVNLDDLVKGQYLLDQGSKDLLFAHLSDLNEGRNKKNSLAKLIPTLSYDIIRIQNKLYAVYKGKGSNHHLGTGGYGTVKLAQNIQTGEWVALKINNKKGGFAKANEIDIQKKYGVHIGAYERTNKTGANQQEILMKLARGIELRKLFDNKKPLITIEYLQISQLILTEIQKLCQLGILHRDIKGSNILIDLLNNQLTLIDFGLSCFTTNNTYKGKRTGTTGYIAPEILNNTNEKKTYNEATEVYSIGITIGKLIGFKLKDGKFIECDERDDDIEAIDIDDRLPYKNTRVCVLELINSLIHQEPSMRPTLSQARVKIKKIIDTLSTLEKINLTVYVNMSYFKKNIKHQIEKWKESIRPISRIVLMHQDAFDAKKYYEIKRACVAKKLWVSDTVIHYNDKETELPQLIKTHHKSKCSIKNRTNVATVFMNKSDHKDQEYCDNLNIAGISCTIAKKDAYSLSPQIAAQYLPPSDMLQQKALKVCKRILEKIEEHPKYKNGGFNDELNTLNKLLQDSPVQLLTLFKRSKSIASYDAAKKFGFKKTDLLKEIKHEAKVIAHPFNNQLNK